MEIHVIDNLHPEDAAMVQALYSRSPDSVVNHLEKVKESGSGKFMDRYYVGYGHASIGDCGSTTIFIENVSMLAAKAIQDHPLYSGQEASTRYLNFSKQPQVNPVGTEEAKFIQTQWLGLYNYYLPKFKSALAAKHPFDPEVHKTMDAWDKAISARAFDVARGLLPVGTATSLSWHTNLRQARDHLRRLSAHRLSEVREIARKIFDELIAKYPHSFAEGDLNSTNPSRSDNDEYALAEAEDEYIVRPCTVANLIGLEDIFEHIYEGAILFSFGNVDSERLNLNESQALATRPRGSHLSRRLSSYGQHNMAYVLDFGSFRDLQRHRNGYCPLPLVTSRFKLNKFYSTQFDALLSNQDWAELLASINRLISDADKLPCSEYERQYYFPMGVNCLGFMSYSLPQAVYVAELRSAKTVHPSLRTLAQLMGQELKRMYPDMALYVDFSEDSFSAKRGHQDIVEVSK